MLAHLTSRDLHSHFLHSAILNALGQPPRSEARGRLSLVQSASPSAIHELLGREDAHLLYRQVSHSVTTEVLLWKEAVLSMNRMRSGCDMDVFSAKDDAPKILEAVKAALVPVTCRNADAGGVWTGISYADENVVWQRRHLIEAPDWNTIAGNYPPAVSERVGSLMGLENPRQFGRLIIWHGPNGTGKTSAARALLMAWRNKFDPVVVADPEELIARPTYYLDVIENHMGELVAHDNGDDEANGRRAGVRLPRMIIMEDCADLILESSRSTKGDMVGRLLNMTDGLVSQGHKDIFLITFNEQVQRIDPAFLRPGRCITHVEFLRHTQAEARAWLTNRTCPAPVPAAGLSLAELFALQNGVTLPSPSHRAILGLTPHGRA